MSHLFFYLVFKKKKKKKDSFIEIIFWKMTHFLKNIITETNRALINGQVVGIFLEICLKKNFFQLLKIKGRESKI